MTRDNQAQGAFFAIESTDPIVRKEQHSRLVERLKQDGYDVAVVSFPQYGQHSSHFAKQYQSGAYGELDNVGPYTGSVFYALDRYEAAKAIREALGQGKVVIANRFSGSNMAQQGAKFMSSEQRRGYFIWLDNLEFEMLKIPRPDRSFILRLPADLGQADDYERRKLLVQVYDELAMLFPKDFVRIDCARDGKQLDEKTLHELLYRTISSLLPPHSEQEGTVVQLSASPTEETKPEVTAHHTVTGIERMQLNMTHTSPKADKTYYVPALKGELKTTFTQTIDFIRATQIQMLERLQPEDAHYADALTPLAAFYNSSEPVQPARYTNKAIQRFALTELGDMLDANTMPVSLTNYTPRNELEMVADILYPYTTQNYADLKQETANLQYVQKEKLLTAYIEQATKGEQVIDAHYSLDIVCDHDIFDAIRTTLPETVIGWQALTPRYGYDVPEAIEQAGLADNYMECFDQSLTLYSALQAASKTDDAPYALLRGHKFRCRITLDLPQLRTLVQGLSTAKRNGQLVFAQKLRTAIAEVHPLVAEII